MKTARDGLVMLLVPVLVALSTAPLEAQSLTHGSLGGMIGDVFGEAVREVSVSLHSPGGEALRVVDASFSGAYEFDLVAPGDYDVRFERLGYYPLIIQGVRVTAGRGVRVDATLRSAEGTVDDVDIVAHAGVGASAVGAALPGSWLRTLPLLPGAASDGGRVWSRAGAALAIDGLPAEHVMLHVDALPRPLARHPAHGAVGMSAAAGPLVGVQTVELPQNPLDVEWSPSAGGQLLVSGRRGGVHAEGTAHASWSGSALASGDGAAASDATSIRAQGFFGGPLGGDSLTFAGGGHFTRTALPVRRSVSWDEDALERLSQSAGRLGAAQVAAGAGTHGVEIAGGHGRIDWRASDGVALFVRADYARSTEEQRGAGAVEYAGTGIDTDMLSVGSGLIARLGERWSTEGRAGFTMSGASAGADGGTVPVSTLLGRYGLSFGRHPGEFDRRSFFFGQTLHRPAENSDLKFGASVQVDANSWQLEERARSATFLDATGYDTGVGEVRELSGFAGETSFSTIEFGFFGQHVRRFGAGFEMTAGARVDVERLPASDFVGDTLWLRLTGIATDSVPDQVVKFSPRIGLAWSDAATAFDVGVGVYHASADALVLGEALTRQGAVRVRRSIAPGSDWIRTPQQFVDLGPTLSIVAPSYRPPRTVRASSGFSRSLGTIGVIRVGGTFRRTDFLPRRFDLNVSPEPAVRDQHDRPVFGTLVQRGGMLVVEPGSNRRFGEYDAVHAINADGRSEHRGVTVAFERALGSTLGVLASYSYGRTEDDWGGAFRGGIDAAAPAPNQRDWDISDFDIPHRGALGASAAAMFGSIGAELGAVISMRSGLPFTPSTGLGIDANADGNAGGDAAFVDAAIPGMQEVLAQASCVAGQVGRFAARNSCRGPAVRTLDASLAVRLPAFDRAALSLVLEAFDLLDEGADAIDAALLLVDPAAPLTTTAGRIQVPYIANPRFGQPLLRRQTARTLHIGARVTF